LSKKLCLLRSVRILWLIQFDFAIKFDFMSKPIKESTMSLERMLILGADGQVGRALVEVLPKDNTLALTPEDLNLLETEKIKPILKELKPTAVINAAAYTQVDMAETERETAQVLNAEVPRILSGWCHANDVPIVHFSTDYVYPGTGDRPWCETDATKPCNYYGQTKLEGDLAIEQSKVRHLIFRTSWVYDEIGKNFVNTMIKLAQQKEELKIIDDQIGAPTYAPHLAQNAMEALQKALKMPNFPAGIYHASGDGEASWYDFAICIFEELKNLGVEIKVKKVVPISTSQYPTPAVRPNNSRLNMDKLNQIFGLQLPDWKAALKVCMKNKFSAA
jgi:dTDP-4-dehydrorhamnose reductase